MKFIYTLYTSFLIASLLLEILLIIFSLRYRSNRVVQAFWAMALVSISIQLSTLLSMYSPNATWSVWWHGNVRLAAYAFLLPVSLWFIHAFIQQTTSHREALWFKLILAFSILDASLCLTNSWHRAVFGDYIMTQTANVFLRQSWESGWWYWVRSLVAFGLSAGMIWALWRWQQRARRLPRLRGAVMISTALIVVGSMMLDTSGLHPAPGLLWIPLSMGFMNVLIMAALWYLDMFDVLPIARATLLSHMSDIVVVLDAQDRIIDMNLVGETTFGVKLAQVKGQDILQRLPENERDNARHVLAQPSYRGKARLDTQGGERIFDAVLTGIYMEKDYLGAKLVVLRDITGSKHAEESLRQSEEQHRLLFETMTQGVVYQTADGQIISANPAAEKILGLTLDQMMERTSMDIRWHAIHEDLSEFPGENHPAMQALSTGRPVVNVIMGIYNPQDEAYRWLDVSAIPQFQHGQDQPYQVYTTFTDITEFRELQHEERRLAAIEERQRLAREFHDAVSQTLFSARLTAEMLLKQAESQPAQVDLSNLEHLARLVKSALGEMRILLLELRPERLANSELPVLLTHLVDAAGSRSAADIHLNLETPQHSLPVDVKIAIYRIAQEAINNAIRHASARQVDVILHCDEAGVQLSVADDGRGFDPAQARTDRFGLSFMHERAAAIGASLSIDSQTGQGTRLACTWEQ